MKKAAILLFVSICLSGGCLSGCGQTGPLYLPKPSSPKPNTPELGSKTDTNTVKPAASRAASSSSTSNATQ